LCDQKTAAKATERAFAEISRIEDLMSPYKQESDFFRINHANGPVRLDRETFDLIKRSTEISAATGGAFDISFASIAHLWNYKDPEFAPPSRQEVNRFLPLVNYRNIRLTDGPPAISLPRGMKIGAGGIAKGYAVKKAVEALKKEGVGAGIVEEGGDLQVFGSKAGGPWLTGLMHPREKTLLLSIGLTDMDSIATSGDYERFVEYGGKRYPHIIDPRTGYPAQGMMSVSVLTKDPVTSDAFATAFFVMGVQAVKEFLKKKTVPGLSVILIDSAMKMHISRGLKKRVSLLEKTTDVVWIDSD